METKEVSKVLLLDTAAQLVDQALRAAPDDGLAVDERKRLYREAALLAAAMPDTGEVQHARRHHPHPVGFYPYCDRNERRHMKKKNNGRKKVPGRV